ncbi:MULTISPECIES: hypothetical protein [unclassified Cryobacterium]|uniref:hypothetical protein n=1 Tax=unclassified Cryobacterium TaxID=2649013 RepID=UPI00106A313E|nr:MULTISPECIES: hypothetical protein [unclassified Cryobacterium]TFB97666.1 hypothetical protein E3O39_07590 [Cryobacterium sp. MDB2-A-1]TFC07786.1 hypothetical protein E3O35_18220 [Cryobacterium sp. MDB2-A-2]TFC11410.1 hypothetical protein E3O59_00080 [Cryobacterium sp. MDB2-33-2]
MQNSDSLKWERYILDLIYDVPAEFAVEHADSPDFYLTRNGYTFGVEITELFKDGSSARLVKLPDYMQRLWDGEEPIHKDDVKGINVVTIRIEDPDGNVVQDNVKAIFSETGSLRDHADALAEHIERKNKAQKGYDYTLGHINLIVGDHFSSSESIGAEYSTAEFFTPRLRAALQTSPFREVILISNILYDNVAWVPLRQLELMESFMVFVHCVYQSSEALDLLEEEDLAHLFAFEMESRGRTLVLRREREEDFAARGNVSVTYTVDGGTLVHEYADWPLDSVPTIDRRKIELPEHVRQFISDEFTKASDGGAGIETAYIRKVREAVWPFDSVRGVQSFTADRVGR